METNCQNDTPPKEIAPFQRVFVILSYFSYQTKPDMNWFSYINEKRHLEFVLCVIILKPCSNCICSVTKLCCWGMYSSEHNANIRNHHHYLTTLYILITSVNLSVHIRQCSLTTWLSVDHFCLIWRSCVFKVCPTWNSVKMLAQERFLA